MEGQRRKHTLLWILGWIFIFPVPLTIIMLRQRELDKKVKIGIIAGGWLLYFIIGGVLGNRNNTAPPEPETVPGRSVAVVAEADETTTKAPVVKKETTTAPVQTEEVTVTETEPAPETTAPPDDSLSWEAIQNAVENGDYSLVSPEFKQTMDAYEAFCDSYIAFMASYMSGGDVMAMLDEYYAILEQLEEWEEKIDAIDEELLSAADDAYYLLVTLRVTQKMLSAVY